MKTPTPTLTTNQVASNLFYYRNATSQLQIIRVNQRLPQAMEKVVFPGEQVLFQSTSDTFLEVQTNTKTGLTIMEQVPCSQLQVLEQGL